MRIALFGGTFNPVHVGHLAAAEAAREALKLDRVVFVPCRQPPHKPAADLAEGRDRLAMVRLAIRGNRAFAASDVELRRRGPSYTIDTVAALRRRSRRRTEWYLLLGADALADLPPWREARRLVRRVQVVAVGRPGRSLERLRGPLGRAFGAAFVRGLGRRRVDAPRLDVASSDLRRRVRAGRTLRYLVPEAVRAYIAAHRLYRARRRLLYSAPRRGPAVTRI